MKLKTEFKGNNIPYEYAAGADVSDSINGNPIKSFPFEVTELPEGTKYLAWSLIDYDAIPVCGFAWIHWSVANVSVSGNSISIKQIYQEQRATMYKVKIASLVVC